MVLVTWQLKRIQWMALMKPWPSQAWDSAKRAARRDCSRSMASIWRWVLMSWYSRLAGSIWSMPKAYEIRFETSIQNPVNFYTNQCSPGDVITTQAQPQRPLQVQPGGVTAT